MDAILRGTDLPDLGVVEACTLAPDLAIALTRGLRLKSYQYTDPNEDVVAATRADGRTALVVADGHRGHQASHAAVDALLRRMVQEIPVWSRREAVRAFHGVNTDIREVRRTLPSTHRATRTTLALAVVATDEDDQRFLTHCVVGDSAVVVLRGGEVHQLSRDRPYFLGDSLTPPLVAGSLDYDQTDLEPDDLVVVVSDGFTNFAPVWAIADAQDDDPAVMARQIIDIAGEAGAGDNVAVAVLGPAPDAPRSP